MAGVSAFIDILIHFIEVSFCKFLQLIITTVDQGANLRLDRVSHGQFGDEHITHAIDLLAAYACVELLVFAIERPSGLAC